MTDLQALRELFLRFKLTFIEAPVPPNREEHVGGIEITVYGGYVGFCSSFTFDKDGKFIEHGAYE